MAGDFALKNVDGKARNGELKTLHGKIESPFFMPVETKGTPKFVSQEELGEIGTRAIILNSLLLNLKPGLEIIEKAGGIHKFIDWNNIIFSDSGGFQILKPVFVEKITEKGVWFKSPFDSSKKFLSPEESIGIQETLMVDVMMCLDDVPVAGSNNNRLAESLQRTMNWAERCLNARENKKRLLFGIAQGGVNEKLRKKCTSFLVERSIAGSYGKTGSYFNGISIGGLCIGEKRDLTYQMLELSNKLIPMELPKYAMGIGSPVELLESIERGIDIFDSAFPTRMARQGRIFTLNGEIDFSKNSKLFEKNFNAIDEHCSCPACKNFSTAYLHHLFKADEPSGKRYLSHHNLWFVQNLMKQARIAIKENNFAKFKKSFLGKYKPKI